MRIEDNDLSLSARCMQLIGARAVDIVHNRCHDIGRPDQSVGIFLTGSADVRVVGNRVIGVPTSDSGTGISLGHVSESGSGSDYLSVTRTTIANNVVTGFSHAGIGLDWTSDTDVVNNTSFDNGSPTYREPGFTTSNRGTGNTNVRVWNNYFDWVYRAPGDAAFALDANNIVLRVGPGGTPSTVDPGFVDRVDFALATGSMAIDAGSAAYDGTPSTDIDGAPRVGPPDVGAHEHGGIAPAPSCE